MKEDQVYPPHLRSKYGRNRRKEGRRERIKGKEKEKEKEGEMKREGKKTKGKKFRMVEG